MQCPNLTGEQVDYLSRQFKKDDELIYGILSFIKHEMLGEPVSIESLAQNMKKSRNLASRVFYLLAGMMLIDYSLAGMPRSYNASLNENGRRVVHSLLKDETNPNGVIEIVGKEVRKVE